MWLDSIRKLLGLQLRSKRIRSKRPGTHRRKARPQLEALEDRITPSGTISGTVIDDANGDGVKDPTETGLAGATITLYQDANANGTFEMGTDTTRDSATTTSTGVWSFTVTENPNNETFFVVETNPAGYNSTNAIPGTGGG